MPTLDTDPITLQDAASHFGFSVWTLRTEAGKGRLAIYRIGRKDYTTANDVREMVEKCRVEKRGQGSISIRSASNGSSGTDRASSALAAANETVRMLRSPSLNTSEASTSRSRQVRR